MFTVTNKVQQQKEIIEQYETVGIEESCRPVEKQPTKYTGRGEGYFPNKLSHSGKPRVVKIMVKRQKKQKLDVSD